MKHIWILYVGALAAVIGTLLSLFFSCVYFFVATTATAMEIYSTGILAANNITYFDVVSVYVMGLLWLMMVIILQYIGMDLLKTAKKETERGYHNGQH